MLALRVVTTLYNNVPKELVFYEPLQVSRYKSHEHQLEYQFVLSPFGGGTYTISNINFAVTYV